MYANNVRYAEKKNNNPNDTGAPCCGGGGTEGTGKVPINEIAARCGSTSRGRNSVYIQKSRMRYSWNNLFLRDHCIFGIPGHSDPRITRWLSLSRFSQSRSNVVFSNVDRPRCLPRQPGEYFFTPRTLDGEYYNNDSGRLPDPRLKRNRSWPVGIFDDRIVRYLD